MYSRTTPTSDHDIKRAVLPYLPTDSKVIATASTRLYHAPFGSEPPNWTFSGLSGVLVFGRDRVRVHPDHRIGTGPGTSFEFSYWFRLIELRLSKGLVWMHQIPHHLDYRMDKPFFHVFLANTRIFGFRFDEDAEASKFHKRVTSHIRSKGLFPSRKNSRKSTNTANSPRGLSPAIISSPTPNSFVHMNHVGLGAKGNIIVSDDIEPGWAMMLEELQDHGVTEKMIKNESDFVDGFWAGVKAASPKDSKLGLELEIQPSPPPPPPKTRRVVKRKPVTQFA